MVYSSDRTITQLNELASGNIDVTNDEIPIWDVNAAAGQRTMKTKVISLLSRVTTSMISGLDAALAARLQVFGTPTNGQIPKWNTTNNRAEWSADATGGGGGATNLSLANNTTTTIDVLSDTGTDVTLPAATTSLAGLMSSADKTKLNGVASGATANATDAQLRDRATHTGTQAATTITLANTNRLLGRSTAGAGAAEEISIGSNLTLSGGVLSASGAGGGPTGYNYVQQSVPSSPADDERWLELDSNGVPVEAWYYDNANTRWLSIARYVNGTTLTNVGASTTNRFNFGAPAGSGLLLIRVAHRVESTSNHSGTAFWSISMGVTSLTGTTAISGTTTFNTQTLVSSATSTFSENVAIVLPAGHNFAVSYNRTSTPANIWATTETTVRIIR